MDVIGLVVGMALTSTFANNEDTFAYAIFMAMLGGSFLFVAISCLIPAELEKAKDYRFPAVIVMMISFGGGYGLMAFLIGHIV